MAPAVWLLSGAKNGISSCELARAVGVTQKTAWFMLHRIRHAMQSGTFSKTPGEITDDQLHEAAALGMLTPAQMREYRLIYPTARTFYCLSDLSILTKQQQIVRFTPNSVQAQYLRALELEANTDARALGGRRELILKARQFGFSTLILALLFLNTINSENTNTVVIAHDLESTEKLFRIVSRFYQHLPGEKPPTQYASKREIFWPAFNSRISILTAGKGTAGRGDTINNLHMSEWGFWDDEEVVTGLLQAIPAGGNIFAESTANGRGNQFHTEYQLGARKIEQARDGRTRSTFAAHFFPWHQHEEYQCPPAPDMEITPEEEVLARLYTLTVAQLAWRRQKMLEPGMGHLFAQEYPADDEEAFRVTGGTFFDTFDADIHTVTPVFTPDARPPAFYRAFGGLDWGYADPFAFGVCVTDEVGNTHVLESGEETRLRNEEQAERVCLALARWGIAKDRFYLVCDGSMWYSKTVNGQKAEPDIAAFQRAGLRCFPAANDPKSIQHRNSQIRAHLAEPGKLKIYRGYNSRLVECLEGARHDPTKVEMVLHDEFSHLVVMLGQALSTRPRASSRPIEEDEDAVFIKWKDRNKPSKSALMQGDRVSLTRR